MSAADRDTDQIYPTNDRTGDQSSHNAEAVRELREPCLRSSHRDSVDHVEQYS